MGPLLQKALSEVIESTVIRLLPYKKWFPLFLILFLLLALFKSLSFDLSDFAAYYFGSKLLLNGDYRQAYDTFAFNEYIRNLGYTNVFAGYVPFPPFTAFLYAPFTFLDVYTARILLNILSGILFLFTFQRTVKHFSISPLWYLLIPLVLFFPILNNLLFGQAYLLVFVLLMEGFLAMEKERIHTSSLWWSIAILFKVFPVLIFLFLFFRKSYNQIIILALFCLGFFLLSGVFVGFDTWIYYVVDIFPRLNKGELNDPYTHFFQSFFMLSKNLLVGDSLMNPKPLLHSPLIFLLLNVLFKTSIISLVAMATRKIASSFQAFSLWIFASILISPNGSTYSLILLLIPLFAFFPEPLKKTKSLITLLLCCIAFNLPIYLLPDLPEPLLYPRLFLLIIIGFLIFPKDTPFDLKLSVIFLLIFLIPPILFSHDDSDQSAYLLMEEKHLLIHDFSTQNEKLQYAYYTPSGSKTEVTEIAAKNLKTFPHLLLVDHTLLLNGDTLLDGNDNKLKPMVLNDTMLVYLSDKNRGVGFYTLRMLPLPNLQAK